MEDLSSDDSSDGQVPEDCRPPLAARFGKGSKEPPSEPPGDTASGASRKRSASDTQSSKSVSSSGKRLRSEIYVSSPDEPDGAPAQEDCRPSLAARHGKGTKEPPARSSGDSAPGDSAPGASLRVSTPPRRSPRKHYIVRFANALDAFPDHQSSLSLYELWSEERKAKELSKYRKVGQDNADEAEALAERFQRGAQKPAYAFEIILGRSNASLELARSDGEMLQLAGRFAGASYIPKWEHSESLQYLMKKIRDAWQAAYCLLSLSSQEISFSALSGLTETVHVYFEHRANWAARDFAHVPDLASAVRRMSAQSVEVKTLLAKYQAFLSSGIREQRVSVAQAHKCWFEVLFPFCSEHGAVPTVAAPTVPPLFIASPPAPSSAQSAGFSGAYLPAQAFQGQYPAQSHTAATLPPPSVPPPPAATPQHQFQRSYQTPPRFAQQPQRQVVRQLVLPSGQGGGVGFVGKPVSASIVGPALATCDPPSSGCVGCGGPHWRFECPLAYYARYAEPCPGFDAHGAQVPGAWAHGEIKQSVKGEWRSYLARHNVPSAERGPAGRAPAVDFS